MTPQQTNETPDGESDKKKYVHIFKVFYLVESDDPDQKNCTDLQHNLGFGSKLEQIEGVGVAYISDFEKTAKYNG